MPKIDVNFQGRILVLSNKSTFINKFSLFLAKRKNSRLFSLCTLNSLDQVFNCVHIIILRNHG